MYTALLTHKHYLRHPNENRRNEVMRLYLAWQIAKVQVQMTTEPVGQNTAVYAYTDPLGSQIRDRIALISRFKCT